MSKLDFMLSLSELVINIARLHTSPLSLSSSSLAEDQLRHVEQLVLNLHALQLLASSLQLARSEFQYGHLHRSSTVRNSAYHTSLLPCTKVLPQSISVFGFFYIPFDRSRRALLAWDVSFSNFGTLRKL